MAHPDLTALRKLSESYASDKTFTEAINALGDEFSKIDRSTVWRWLNPKDESQPLPRRAKLAITKLQSPEYGNEITVAISPSITNLPIILALLPNKKTGGKSPVELAGLKCKVLWTSSDDESMRALMDGTAQAAIGVQTERENIASVFQAGSFRLAGFWSPEPAVLKSDYKDCEIGFPVSEGMEKVVQPWAERLDIPSQNMQGFGSYEKAADWLEDNTKGKKRLFITPQSWLREAGLDAKRFDDITKHPDKWMSCEIYPSYFLANRSKLFSRQNDSLAQFTKIVARTTQEFDDYFTNADLTKKVESLDDAAVEKLVKRVELARKHMLDETGEIGIKNIEAHTLLALPWSFEKGQAIT